ncbi:MAG: alkaline phosphatase family protein [Candidatus Diapherotrites archaeon]
MGIWIEKGVAIGMNKVFVLGIDGAPFQLIFNEWLDELPNIKQLMLTGVYAKSNSTIPPSTILAWTAFASGYDPGQMGVYSYTVRENKLSDETNLVNSTCKKKKMIWDLLSANNKKSIVLNVPLTYPVNEINGTIISGFLTPGLKSKCCYPEEFKEELSELFDDEYMFDVSGFVGYKNLAPKELIKRIYKLTEMNFTLIDYFLKNKEWDFFMSVLIGSDRLQHNLWRFIDEKHIKYEYDSELKDSIKNYYKYIDKKLGEIISLLPPKTTVIVASDHGFDRMDGRINLNQWLIDNSYLVLKPEIQEKIKKEKLTLKLSYIDWTKTKAYSVGAYQGRIYLNTKKRTPSGIVASDEVDLLKNELKQKLIKIKKDTGEKLNNKVFFPEEIYVPGFTDESPDLIVYFDNLKWGVNNDIGHDSLYSWSTIVGSDDAGHAPQGLFIMSGNKIAKKGNLGEISILDVTPSILELLNLEIPKDMKGKSVNFKGR